MAKPETPASSTTALLDRLNLTVEEAESEVESWKRFLSATKTARDTLVKTMLSPNGSSRRQRTKGSGSASRTQMLQTILENAPNPVTVDEILAEMAKHGRADERRLVYSTLSYLARKGSAKTSERGKWVSVTEEKQKAA